MKLLRGARHAHVLEAVLSLGVLFSSGALTSCREASAHGQGPPPPAPDVSVAHPVVSKATEWDEFTGH